MLAKMRLQTRLLVVGVALSAIPMTIMLLAVLYQNNQMAQQAAQECVKLATADLDHIAQGIVSLCKTQDETIQQNIDNTLKLAQRLLKETGQVTLAKETVTWEAVNQSSDATSSVTLPKMMVGDTWLGQNRDRNVASAIVDDVGSVAGVTCTIFQRMNDKGEMLRVSTNLIAADGARAIGTFIPAVDPPGSANAGKANPVVAALLGGQTYHGRAFAVNTWYLTAYEPIRDPAGKVVGAICAALPIENVKSLRQAIVNTKVGKTGYVYVLDSEGHYVISKDGERDGEIIWDVKDANGELFIQEVIKKALALKEGEIAEQRYPWKNDGDLVAREKVVRIAHFAPWDWTIGVGSYIDEFKEAETLVRATGTHTSMVLLTLVAITLGLTIVVWFFVAAGLNRKLGDVTMQLREASEQVSSASTHLTQSGQELAAGASEQASSLEETSAALEQISGQARNNAESAQEAAESVAHVAEIARQSADGAQKAQSLSDEARQAAEGGAKAVDEIAQAMRAIREGSEQVTDIIEVIDDITHQTKMLATNAAIEAARAGDQGKGFAVVADEVSKLAEHSKTSAKEISELIRETARRAQVGSELAERGNQALKNILEKSLEVAQLISEIARNAEEQATGVDGVGQLVSSINKASSEQAVGVDQVTKATAQMDQVTQGNAATAEESASASEELSAQALSLQAMVQELVAVMEGSRGRAEALAASNAKLQMAEDLHRAASSHAATPSNGKQASSQRNGQSQQPAPAPTRARQLIPMGADDFSNF